MKKIILIVLILQIALTVLHIKNCQSQVWEEWRAYYIGPYNLDHPSSMIADPTGNVYVTGGSHRTASIWDYATVKYNTSGAQEWAARYNWPNGTANFGAVAFSIAVDRYGNVYVSGTAPINSSGNPVKTTTVKYNLSGFQQWVSIFYGQTNNLSDNPGGQSVAVDDSGYVYVATNSYWPNYGNYIYTTIKYNSSGIQQWVALYGRRTYGSYDSAPCKVIVDNSGNVYVTGYSMGDTTYNDIATVKYNFIGRQQWVARYNGPGNGSDSATDMRVDNQGNVYVCGASWGNGSKYDYITIKYNSSGVQQWAARYNGAGNWTDVAKSIGVDNSGNVYVTGYTSGVNYKLNYATIKYSPDGVQQWVAIYDSGYYNEAVSLAIDQQGYIYVTGETAPVTYTHIGTIKYSPSGKQQWAILTSYNGDQPVAIALDSLDNVYVSGYEGTGSNGNYLTIKYGQLVGINPVSNDVPHEYRLNQNYPNPFNPSTKIMFGLPFPSQGGVMDVTLTIYDILGREVATLVNEKLSPGIYEIEWDASGYPSGVYFYKLEAGDYVKVKKMILLR